MPNRQCFHTLKQVNASLGILPSILTWFLSIAVWLQMWAFSTENYGIAVSTVGFLVAALLYLRRLRVSKTLVLGAIGLICWVVVVSWVNDLPPSVWILRACRYAMLIVLAVVCSGLFSDRVLLYKFMRSLLMVVLIGCFYGIYQYIAPSYGMPYFLNVFSNNTSFYPKELYDYYGGWVEHYRVYGVFSEPSFYGAFLALCCVILLYVVRPVNKMCYLFAWIFILSNIYLTYSRVAYTVTAVILVIYLASSIVRFRKGLGYWCLSTVVVSLPLIMPIVMKLLFISGIFTDSSMTGRLMSQNYYFGEALAEFRIVGYGVGSITAYMGDVAQHGYIEAHAHNALATLSYEMGLLAIAIYYLCMFWILRTTSDRSYGLCLVGAIAAVLSFGEAYSIESTLILMCALASWRRVKLKRVRLLCNDVDTRRLSRSNAVIEGVCEAC